MDGMIGHDPKGLHHPHAHVAIQVVVGRENGYIVLLQELSALEKWCTHVDTQALGLIRTRDDATIVVAQYHNGTIVQMRFEQAFAGTVEAITIDDGKHGQTAWIT